MIPGAAGTLPERGDTARPTNADVLRSMSLEGWAWSEGMSATGEGVYAPFRFWFHYHQTDPEGPTTHPRTGLPGRWYFGNEPAHACTTGAGWFPDVTDPATGGCLFELMRSAGDDGLDGIGTAPPGSDTWTLGEVCVYVALRRGYWKRAT